MLLHGHGPGLVRIQEELSRNPHDDSATEKFSENRARYLRTWSKCKPGLGQSLSRTEEAIANHDFAKARSCSDEERKKRDKLYSLCQQHRLLPVWLYEYKRVVGWSGLRNIPISLIESQ